MYSPHPVRSLSRAILLTHLYAIMVSTWTTLEVLKYCVLIRCCITLMYFNLCTFSSRPDPPYSFYLNNGIDCTGNGERCGPPDRRSPQIYAPLNGQPMNSLRNFGSNSFRPHAQGPVFMFKCEIRTYVSTWVHKLQNLNSYILFVTTDRYTAMRRLTTGLCSEKFVVRRFRRYANVIKCTTHLVYRV